MGAVDPRTKGLGALGFAQLGGQMEPAMVRGEAFL